MFHLTMKRHHDDPANIRLRVLAHRARQVEAGRQLVNTYLPGELVELIDQAKEAKGARGRTPIIEEALRFYFEKQQEA